MSLKMGEASYHNNRRLSLRFPTCSEVSSHVGLSRANQESRAAGAELRGDFTSLLLARPTISDPPRVQTSRANSRNSTDESVSAPIRNMVGALGYHWPELVLMSTSSIASYVRCGAKTFSSRYDGYLA